jgi:hypothetical protein
VDSSIIARRRAAVVVDAARIAAPALVLARVFDAQAAAGYAGTVGPAAAAWRVLELAGASPRQPQRKALV